MASNALAFSNSVVEKSVVAVAYYLLCSLDIVNMGAGPTKRYYLLYSAVLDYTADDEW